MLSLRLAARPGYTVLCIGAHCDDIEIGCGGTVLRLLEERSDVSVHWVVLSSDEKRSEEARASAEAFLAGAKSAAIVVESFRNGFFPFIGAEIKEYFERLKATLSPDLIFTHCRDDLHQDHQVVGKLTWNTFRDHFILEYEIPKYDGDMGTPNVFWPLGESNAGRKIELILRHFKSQQSRAWFDCETFRAVLRLRGMECKSPSRYAEAFYCRKLVMDLGEGERGRATGEG